jgi:hypothetical protein
VEDFRSCRPDLNGLMKGLGHNADRITLRAMDKSAAFSSLQSRAFSPPRFEPY